MPRKSPAKPKSKKVVLKPSSFSVINYIVRVKHIPLNIVLASLMFLAAFFGLKSEQQRMDSRALGIQTQVKADQETIYAWEQILTERPNYRDGWVQLAAAYYKVGQVTKAQEAVQKAIQLDPNNETIINFQKLLK